MKPTNNGGKKINNAFYQVKFVIDTNIAFVTLAEFLGIKLWTGDRVLMKGLARKAILISITTDELSKLRDLLE
ncbi:MAG: hypothetical protein R2795_02685 [Saprospiraceae bacterium]